MFKKEIISSVLRVILLSLILMTMFSGFVFAQTVVLSQAPTGFSAYPSDPDQPQSVAENFSLSSTSTIIQIRIWGCYISLNTPGTDNFRVIFHADSGGLPGAVISDQSNVPVNRQLSGGPAITGTLTEYVYTLTLATPVALAPGTYWVEIFNDVTGTGDVFGWEDGTSDPVNGVGGFATDNVNVPGTSWSSSGAAFNTAIELTAATTAVPTMNEWGMIIFVALAGLGAAFYLRRQKTTKS